MIPGTTAAIVGFLFFIAPGLVWELGRERKRPALEGSTFREISRVALTSVGFTVLALMIVAAMRIAFPDLLADVGAWIRHPSLYLQRHYDRVALSAVIELVVACGLAWAFSGFPMPWRATDEAVNIATPITWSIMSEKVDGCAPMVSARLCDNVVYTGRLMGLDFTTDRENRYLALCQPMSSSRDGAEPQPVERHWQRMLLPLGDVREMSVRWAPISSLET